MGFPSSHAQLSAYSNFYLSLNKKLGLAPFHSSQPEATQGVSPQTGLILI